MEVETGVFPQANGSVRVKIDHGATSVIAVVKCEVGEPSPSRPREGRVVVGVEISGSMFPKFDDRHAADLQAEATGALARVIQDSSTMDTHSLCIIPGRFCWVVYVDILVLRADGNVLDATSFAAYAALNTARVPKLTVVPGEAGASEDDFELSSDVADSVPLLAQDVPVCITLSLVGRQFLVDATGAEEDCASCGATVAVNRQGRVCGLRKIGAGGLPLPALPQLLQGAQQTASLLFPSLEAAIQNCNPQA